MKNLISIPLAVVIMVGFFAVSIPSKVFSMELQEITISGLVTETGTDEPLAGVHVYFSQTTVGTTTDENGEYTFSSTLTGQHELVFSFIGFQTKKIGVQLSEQRGSYQFEIELEPDTFDLDEVEVVASGDAVWFRNLEKFKERFVGTSYVAGQAEIVNPWVLNFEQDEDNNFRVYASRPIQIKNRAFGYILHVDLVDFMWEERENLGFYTFYLRFEEMEAVNDREERDWKSNRSSAYRGSFSHFLKSLYNDELRRNRFEVVVEGTRNRVQIQELNALEMRSVRNRLTARGVASSGNVKGFWLRAPVDVLYGRRSRTSDNRARSRLVPMDRSGAFLVTENGSLVDPLSLRLDGSWSHYRVGDLLPLDYTHEDE